MKEYTELKNKIVAIIEKSNSDKPACKNCKTYNDGICMLDCVNERNGIGYRFNNGRRTTPDYYCDNFNVVYKLSEDTKETLETLIKDIDRVNEGAINLELFISGRIDEKDFNEMMK